MQRPPVAMKEKRGRSLHGRHRAGETWLPAGGGDEAFLPGSPRLQPKILAVESFGVRITGCV
jgi:hypothetical protein